MIKCDKRAFSKCKYKEHCGLDAEFSEGSECEKFNRLIIYQPMTNADRIRSMSDEELANFMLKHEGTETRRTAWGGHEHKFYGPHGEKCETRKCAVKMWTDWLRQPAEED